MQEMMVFNLSRSKLLCSQAKYANRFFNRLIGLLGKKEMLEGEGMIIYPCNMVHSLGMRMSIDVLFLNNTHEVVYCMERMPPNKISPSIKNASYVIELPAGLIAQTKTDLGDNILCKAIAI